MLTDHMGARIQIFLRGGLTLITFFFYFIFVLVLITGFFFSF